MEEEERKVFYLSFGSNLLSRRFMNYIQGGTLPPPSLPPLSLPHPFPTPQCITNSGCSDRSPPLLSLPVIISRNMYFARNGRTWGGAPAFLDIQSQDEWTSRGGGGGGGRGLEMVVGDRLGASFRDMMKEMKSHRGFVTEEEGEEGEGGKEGDEGEGRGEDDCVSFPFPLSLCRMYLITEKQFIQFVEQENGSLSSTLSIIPMSSPSPFTTYPPPPSPSSPALPGVSSYTFPSLLSSLSQGTPAAIHLFDSFYGHIVFLGHHHSYPIFTFSSHNHLDSSSSSSPPLSLSSPPSPSYLAVIARGIRESFSICDDDVIAYLSSRPGFLKALSPSQLKSLLSEEEEEKERKREKERL
jgi:hypothetical protein